MSLSLTKACAGGVDLAFLYEEINWLGAGVTMGQHPMRIWEYALAVRALQTWMAEAGPPAGWEGTPPLRLLDVGGAGSQFGPTLGEKLGPAWAVELVDPKETVSIEDRVGEPASVILAISTIEHVPDPFPFLRALADNLIPGGLLFLTMDGWGQPEGTRDTAHFHWMRERIYDQGSWRHLARQAAAFGLHLWGGADWVYRGDQVYGYSFLSLCLCKA